MAVVVRRSGVIARAGGAGRTGAVSAGTPLLQVFVAIALLAAGLIDTPQLVTVGPVSGLGAWTIVLTLASLAGVVACGTLSGALLLGMLPYMTFLGWIGISVMAVPPSFWGVQNGMLYLLFGALALVAGTQATRRPHAVLGTIDRCMLITDVVALSIIGLNLTLRGYPTEAGMWWVGPRSAALFGIMALGWHLSGWYYGSRRDAILAGLWMAGIAITLSRTAMGVSLGLLGLLCILQVVSGARGRVWTVAAFTAALLATSALLTYSQPFRQRFFTGDMSITLGGVRINGEGRMEIWDVVMRSANERPVLGHGVGSSQDVIYSAFPGNPRIDHPHNDYLRIWHDLGAVGLLLFAAAVVSWLRACARAWLQAQQYQTSLGRLPLAGFMGLLGLLTAMITDNVVVYVFAMTPLAILLGSALGAGIVIGDPVRRAAWHEGPAS